MAVFDYDIGIISGGGAGLMVAAGASRLGAKTLLVEEEFHANDRSLAEAEDTGIINRT